MVILNIQYKFALTLGANQVNILYVNSASTKSFAMLSYLELNSRWNGCLNKLGWVVSLIGLDYHLPTYYLHMYHKIIIFENIVSKLF